jgi:hypothetical protein
MAIYPRLMGILADGGKVVFLCKECKAPPQDAMAVNVLIVCSNCGQPLGEWDTAEEREAEINAFAEKVRLHGAPAPRRTARAYRSKEESKSKNMPRGGGGGRKKKTKYGRKRGHK